MECAKINIFQNRKNIFVSYDYNLLLPKKTYIFENNQ